SFRFMAGAEALFANGDASGATFAYTARLDGSSEPFANVPQALNQHINDQRLFLGAYGSAEWRPLARLTVNGGMRLNVTSESQGAGNSATNTRPSGSLGAM